MCLYTLLLTVVPLSDKGVLSRFLSFYLGFCLFLNTEKTKKIRLLKGYQVSGYHDHVT